MTTTSPANEAPLLTIQSTRGWGRLELGELWRYRELLWFLASREVKGRYRQMALGPLWILIKPLVDMIVFTIVFGGLAKLPSEGLPYPLFTYAAILPWTYFQTAASGSAGSLVARMNVVSKVYFPRLIVPLSAVLTPVVDLFVSFSVLFAMVFYYGVELRVRLLLLPGYVLLAFLTALAIGLWSAALTVRFRDLRFAVTYGLRVGMYATPVAYSSTLVAERFELVYQMNPMFWVVEGFRWSILGTGRGPELLMLVPVALVLALLASGAYVFRRSERTVVDLL